MADRRVAVTGLGVVSSLGTDVETFWRRCLAGDSVVAPVPEAWHRYSRLRSGFWSPLGDWERDTPLWNRLGARQMDPFSRLALLAAEEALTQAALVPEPDETAARRGGFRIPGVDPVRTGVFLGTGVGGEQTLLESTRFISFERQFKKLRGVAKELRESGGGEAADEIDEILDHLPLPRALNPLSVSMAMPNAAASHLSIKLGITGICRTYAAACASGTMALGRAFRAIRSGECELALTGGVEYLGEPYGCAFRGFDAVGALVRGDRPPEELHRPFDRDHSGFLFSEGGAGMLVLEERSRAESRGAAVLAEVTGYGESSDAYDVMAMEPSGEQIRRALEDAVEDAGLDLEEVGYVNAHGTGTETNDPLEARILEELFGRGAAISATKSLLGHTLGASGALEAVVTALTLERGMGHPCRNLDDPIADLAFLRRAESVDARHGLSVSFAFGGQNAAVVLSRG